MLHLPDTVTGSISLVRVEGVHLPDSVPGSISLVRVEGVTFTGHCSW